MAVIAAAAVASLAACGGSSGSSSSGARADKVMIGLSSDNAPTGYDPEMYARGRFFFSDLYDSLVAADQENPSWLYGVTMGATTIGECWDSMLPDGSITTAEVALPDGSAPFTVGSGRHTFAAIIAEPRPVERPRMPDFSLPE